MSEAGAFSERATEKAKDSAHGKQLLRAIGAYNQQVQSRKVSQFLDWQKGRALAAEIKEYVLANLADLLEQFEKQASSKGIKVHWAKDAEEARGIFGEILKPHLASSGLTVIKSKSMVTEEVGLNEFLEHQGVETVETDLGELIVQLAGEKPYHIVTPAMHKSRAQIGELFEAKLRVPYSEDPGVLTGYAREFLREKFLKAQIGVTGANFLIAENGAVVICENEGNAKLCFATPRVHVVLSGFEKILPRISDLALFLPLLATSGTGQQLTTYNSIILGAKQTGEIDGPEEMHIILLDNGRTKLYAHERLRESLRCIRCGACLNACPVYRTIGGHSYNTTYQGPIGAVITPPRLGFSKWNHLAFASSLCGACTDVCPVEIDIHHLIVENRKLSMQHRSVGVVWKFLLKLWSIVYLRRRRVTALRKIGAFLQRLGVVPIKAAPKLSKRSFSELWNKREK